MVASASSSLPGSAPIPRTRLIGREAERATAQSLLLDEAVPLLNLTGPGGVGKTRLARTIAHDVAGRFADGVAWLELAPLADSDQVLPAIARALGLRDSGSQPVSRQLIAALRPQTLLLVLDNFEHVLDAAPRLAEVLASCPRLTILVTSRFVLNLSEEHDLPVRPLTLPIAHGSPSLAEIATSEAVRLFVDRARAVRPDFALSDANAETVAAICSRLDGLPLAIELAAARIAHLPLAALWQRLEQRLPLLTGGGRDLPARLRTMRDAIVWSYDLLTPDEQTLFRRLAVFVGGFSLEAAEAVAGDGRREAGGKPSTDAPAAPSVLDGIASLVGKSLLHPRAGPGDEPRYSMLETVREFALEQLCDAGEEAASRDAHLGWFLGYVEGACQAIHVPRSAAWLAGLEPDRDNLRAALAWAVSGRDGEAALRMSGALRDFWYLQGTTLEGRRWLEASFAVAADASAANRARALLALGEFANDLGDLNGGDAALRESLALFRNLGNRLGASHALYLLGCAAVDQGIYDPAEQLLEEARAQAEAVGDRFCANASVYQLGVVALGQGQFELAMAHFSEAQRRERAAGDHFTVANTLWYQGLVHTVRGNLTAAAEALEEAMATERALGGPEGAALFFANFAVLGLAADRPEAATRLLATATGVLERRGMSFNFPERLEYDRARAAARSHLGESAFRSAWDVGWPRAIEGSADDVSDVLNAARRADVEPRSSRYASEVGLTPRELEVLRLVAAGHSNREIADALFIAMPTVKSHLTAILAKLGLPSRSAATAYAHTHGLL